MSADFVRFVTDWAAYVAVAGSSPAGGILSQMCACVISFSASHPHFVSCVMAWAEYVEVAGSGPAGGVLSHMFECIIPFHLIHFAHPPVIPHLWGSNMDPWP